MFSVITLLFVSQLFVPHSKVFGETAQGGAPTSRFSRMSWIEKETTCKNLMLSKEFDLLTAKLHWFIPISIIAFEDKSLLRITTKSQLMAWIGKNLSHTKFRSVAEAEAVYKDIERLQRDIIRKFSEFDFGARSSDIAFLSNYVNRNLEVTRNNMARRNANRQQFRFNSERICSSVHLLFTTDIPAAIISMIACETALRQERISHIERETGKKRGERR
jgi:hypothetical protein